MPTIVLSKDQPFSLDHTLSCGQVFRWEQRGSWWYGLVRDHLIKITQTRSKLTYYGADEEFISGYFQLDLDLPAVLDSIDKDPFIHSAIEKQYGLRLVAQPAWECTISYISATFTNIPLVKRRIALLSQAYGTEIRSGQMKSYTFPDPATLASACETGLNECKLGYRTRYVCGTARFMQENPSWEGYVKRLDYPDARKEVMKLQGVGPKAADCILLFAFLKYDAFPIDVWIQRIMRHYLPPPAEGCPCTPREYDRISRFAREYFGPFAGYAQEYLYAARRVI